MLHRNYSLLSRLGLKNTLFNSGGGSGSFYQGGDGPEDDQEADQEEREPAVICPPIDPQTIELIDVPTVTE